MALRDHLRAHPGVRGSRAVEALTAPCKEARMITRPTLPARALAARTLPARALLVRTGLAGALAAATLALGAAPASAHTALESSDPKANAEIAPPGEITLTYNERIRLPRVVLTGPGGSRHENGPPKADGDKVTQPVNGTLPNGTYTVGWRVVSADGHPVTGTFKFTVKGSTAAEGQGQGQGQGPAGNASNPSGAPTSTPSPSNAAGQEESGGSSSGWVWIGVAGLVVVLVVGGVAWARRPSQD
ncbi:copper resistance CopC family protein [Spirillospora sp. CA-255316]